MQVVGMQRIRIWQVPENVCRTNDASLVMARNPKRPFVDVDPDNQLTWTHDLVLAEVPAGDFLLEDALLRD